MMTESPATCAWVAIPPGKFIMGETPNDKFATDTERPAHGVTLAGRFALSRFSVTVREFRAFAPAHAPADDPDLPVVGVSWDEAVAFCAWMKAETGEPVRLPSEAEWEYACRAGSHSAFALGDELAPTQANFLYAEDGGRVGRGHRTAEGDFPANAFGVCDLQGNVCEWVADGWHPNYAGAPDDGSPWAASGPWRVIRGGAWDYLPRLLRSAWRDGLPRTARRDNVGFRVARSLSISS